MDDSIDFEKVESAHRDAQWVAQALGFLAETLSGGEGEPSEISQDGVFGLSAILKECAQRAWSAEETLGLLHRSQQPA